MVDHDNGAEGPRISVVIPVYNSEDTIAESLSAILNQEDHQVGDDYEIIVVNDGSTDRTREIVEGFSEVNLINLTQNSGRIVARRTGVEAARANIVLLIDSRVIASDTLLSDFDRIGYTPLMAGDLGEDKYSSRYDTLFYLLRRLYYRPYFPQTRYGRELWITPDNFARAPKGTTCMFVEKDMFLSVLPENQGKTVNDDTRIFETIVKDEDIKILRHTDLKVFYKQRMSGPAYRKWLIERGVRFADYYLKKSPIYLFLMLCSYLFIGVFFASCVLAPLVSASTLASLTIVYLALVFVISEERKDWIPVGTSLLSLVLLFWCGVSLGMFRGLFSSRSN